MHIKKNEFVYIAIFLLSLVPRIVKTIIDPLLMRDSALYVTLAETWANTGKYQETIDGGIIIPPLPILIVKELILLGFDGEIAARSISLFLGSIIPLLGYYITKEIFKKKGIAVLCTAILLIHPTLISYSSQPLRENFYLFFECLLIIEIIYILKKGFDSFDLILCGILSACIIFCRYEGLEILIILPTVLLYKTFKYQDRLQRLSFKILLYFSVFFASSFVLLLSVDFNTSFIKKIAHIIRLC